MAIDTIVPPEGRLDAEQVTALTDIVREGRLVVDPALAMRIITEAPYPRQRIVTPAHVALLAHNMRRGTWMPGTQIAFGVLGGKLFLVNGQHRLNAVFESECEIEFQVVLLHVSSDEELHHLYRRFDVEQRTRSLPQILKAEGIAERFDISSQMARTLFEAVLLITAGFKHVHAFKDPVAKRSHDARFAAAAEWAREAALYEQLLAPAPTWLKKRLRNSQMAAVAFVTLRAQHHAASEFWGGIARNDGLRQGDPRHTFLRYLLNRSFAMTRSMPGCQYASYAWNAWYEKRQIANIATHDGVPVKIAGTPYDGKHQFKYEAPLSRSTSAAVEEARV